jgi:hypothetical protein
MSKEGMKEAARERQGGKSVVSSEILPDDTSLFDTHRPVSRVEGGDYTDENTKVLLPTEHRDLHGNQPRIDDPGLVTLRAIMEDYRTCLKLRMKINNQKLAVERRMDEVTPEIEEMFATVLKDVDKHEKYFKKAGEKQLKNVEMPIARVMREIKGIGPIIAAEIITNVDINLSKTPSSLWAYVGYAGPSKDRYKKGVKGGGNKHLRTVMYNLGSCLLRSGNEDYTSIYYRRKAKTEASEKTVMHKHRRHEEYKETAWKDVNPGRRHHDALRIMVKHFLADLWYVWRTLEGLNTVPLYVEEQLGHTDIIQPFERGWEI